MSHKEKPEESWKTSGYRKMSLRCHHVITGARGRLTEYRLALANHTLQVEPRYDLLTLHLEVVCGCLTIEPIRYDQLKTRNREDEQRHREG